MKTKLFIFLIIALVGFGTTKAATRYVKATGSGDGSTWANASSDLQLMINQSDAGDEVWVAGGTYKPIRPDTNTTVITLDNRRNAFVMKSGVSILGGYLGTGIFANLRAPQLYTTILDGDIGTPGDNTDNAYHLVLMLGGNNMLLDGFTIQNGNANGSPNAISVNGYQYGDNGGAALQAQQSSSFSIVNCKMVSNAGTGNTTLFSGSNGKIDRTDIQNNITAGGGHIGIGYAMPAVSVMIQSDIKFQFCHIAGNTSEFGTVNITGGSTTSFYNCAFTGNVVTLNYGSAIKNGVITTIGSDALGIPHTGFLNCVFAGNKHDPEHTKVVYSDTTFLEFNNNIVWGNSDQTSPLFEGSGTVNYVSHSILQGQAWFYNGFAPWLAISDADPQFVNAPSYTAAPFTIGDYHLTRCSPAINTGNNSSLDTTETLDMDGKNRISNNTVDMGIYEYPFAAPDADGIMYVDSSAAPNGDGSSWANAVNELADALKAAKDNNAIQQIWVAKGTYKPMFTADSMLCNSYDARKNSFVLRSNLKLLGGFSGSETAASQRNPADNITTLSGDIGIPGINTDNAYHVVVLANVSNVLMDGFTIKDGNANSNSSITIGGNPASNSDGAAIMMRVCGISATDFDVVINNCNIKNNNSVYGGAVCFHESLGLLSHCNITNNTGDTTAALSVKYSVGMAVSYCKFSGNRAIKNTVQLEGVNGGIKFYNTIFSGNNITNPTYTGGAMPAVFNNNSDTIAAFPQGTELLNCTFSGNKNVNNQAFVIAKNNGKLALKNCVVSGNAGAYTAPSSTCTYNNCIGIWGFIAAPGSGNNIAADPGFADAPDFSLAPFTNGDYHLSRCSPAINAGNNTFFAMNDTNDFAGNKRIIAGNADIGAYEYTMGTPDADGIVYVDSAATPGGDGSAWTSAINEVADALKAAQYDTSIHRINVGKGTYKPLYTADSMLCNSYDNRKKSFVIPDGIKLFGGYSGTPDYVTPDISILSGDIGIANNNSDNAYHVVIAAGTDNPSTMLAYFIIEKGAVDFVGPSMTVNGIFVGSIMGSGMANQGSNQNAATLNRGCGISSCTFRDNAGYYGALSNFYCGDVMVYNTKIINDSSASGGGVANIGGTVKMVRCKVSGNKAIYEGGGIFNRKCNFTLLNSVVTGNYTNGDGGGIKADSSIVLINNATIVANKALSNYGGVGNQYNTGDQTATITNSFIYGNDGTTYDNIDTTNNPLLQVSNCILGTEPYRYGNNNRTDISPQFINPVWSMYAPADSGDYHLMICSPAINAGDNSFNAVAAVPAYATAYDMDYNQRVVQNTVDIGAYETTGYTLTQTPGDSIGCTNFFTGCNYAEYTPGYTVSQNLPDSSGHLILSITQTGSELYDLFPLHFTGKLRPQYGSGSTLQLSNPFGQTGYYLPMNRSWAVTVNGSITTPVAVRFYFDDTDSMDIASQADFGNLQNLIVYKVNGSDAYDPAATGYKEYIYAAAADTNHFSTGTYQGIRYVEFWVTSFSSGSMAFKASTPLVIGLGDITASNTGNKNRIDWETYDEASTDKMILQRSHDGKTFNDLSIIGAKGVPSFYTYWDELPFGGMNYYRLKMTGANGGIAYSKIVSAFVNNKDAFAIEIFPNPAREILHLDIYGDITSNARISICNVAGKEILKLPLNGAKQDIDVSGWGSGLYFLKYADGNRQQVIKIIKQ